MLWKKSLLIKKDYFNLNYFNEKQWKNGNKTIKESKALWLENKGFEKEKYCSEKRNDLRSKEKMICFHGQKNVLIIPRIKRMAEIKTRNQRIMSLTFIDIPKRFLFSIKEIE